MPVVKVSVVPKKFKKNSAAIDISAESNMLLSRCRVHSCDLSHAAAGCTIRLVQRVSIQV